MVEIEVEVWRVISFVPEISCEWIEIGSVVGNISGNDSKCNLEAFTDFAKNLQLKVRLK